MTTVAQLAPPKNDRAAIVPSVDTDAYKMAAREGVSRQVLAKNLLEANFTGLRSLTPYVQALDDRRKAFVRDLTGGRIIESCPFPFEVALLRALHMGLEHWSKPKSTATDRVTAYVGQLRFGVMCDHLSCVVEYEPEVFFRAFQGLEVHRDVPLLEDWSPGRGSMDWSDYRIYGIPDLEKDLLFDLFQLQCSILGRAGSRGVYSLGRAVSVNERVPLPVLVGRQRNRDLAVEGQAVSMIPIAAPGASLHLTLAHGNEDHLSEIFPKLIGEAPESLLPNGAQAVGRGRLKENDIWLVATYTLPPPVADARIVNALRDLEEAE